MGCIRHCSLRVQAVRSCGALIGGRIGRRAGRSARALATHPASCPVAPAVVAVDRVRGSVVASPDEDCPEDSPAAARSVVPVSPAVSRAAQSASHRDFAIVANLGPRVGHGGRSHLHIADDCSRRIQNSASSGVIFNTRMFGSSALSHQAFAGVVNNCLIFARSFETDAVPVTETYFWAPGVGEGRLTAGLRAISSSL